MNADRFARARQFLREEFLRNEGLALIARAPVEIYVTDLEGNIYTANDYAQASHEEINERPLREIIDPDIVQSVMRRAQGALPAKYYKGAQLVQCLRHENHLIWAVSVVGASGSNS